MHEYFNHNDIYHFIQMVGLYFMFRGARAATLGAPRADAAVT